MSADVLASAKAGVAGAAAPAAIVGIDFDNTLVCYDGLFHRLAVEQSLLSSAVVPAKRAIRDHLCAAGREDRWTELQACAYGARILEATAFPGARAFVRACAARGVALFVVSHKTPRAYAGGDVDLCDAARRWLGEQGFFAADALRPEHVHFESTREEKIARIERLGCTHFVDDLPEFLAEPALPGDLVKILFAPDVARGGAGESGTRATALTADADGAGAAWLRARSWSDVASIVLGAALP